MPINILMVHGRRAEEVTSSTQFIVGPTLCWGGLTQTLLYDFALCACTWCNCHSVYCFCDGIYQSVALHLTKPPTSICVCFLWIDRSVSVTIGVHLPCIDRHLQGTLGIELLLQNYCNNVTVMSKRRVVNTLDLTL